MVVTIIKKGSFPATLYGGTERVIWGLGKALSELNHKVNYLVEKKTCYCPFANIFEINPRKSIYEQIPPDTDIVHFNEFEVDDSQMTYPYVITVHGNKLPINLNRNTIFVSRNHAQRFGCNSYVYNGLDWEGHGKVNTTQARSGYHFLGKAAWRVKNVVGAIDVVKKLPDHSKLIVMGGYRINFKMGFRLTLTRRASFMGMVNDKIKIKVMQKSKGLIFPVTWHEPFGLAIIESLYAGCPVFATPYGAIPEIISTPELGFLTNSEAEMVEYLTHRQEYSAVFCHEYAAELFSARKMAKSYLDKYEQVLNGHFLIPEFSEREKEYKGLPWIKK